MQMQNSAMIRSDNLLRDVAEQVLTGLRGRGKGSQESGVLQAKSLGKTTASSDFRGVLKTANYPDG